MKKRISLYWKCQVSGWSVYVLLATCTHLFLPGFSIWNTLLPMLVAGTIGMCVAHLMRLFIIKLGLLQQNVLRQIIYLLLTSIFFAFVYASITIWLSRVFHGGQALISLYTHEYKLNGLLTLMYSDTFFLGIWNLIYFSYHYVQKSQQEQIERIRFESELKIQQLENDKTKIEFQRNLADISLTALRSQMNPHFIFNCLNSIKLYTTQNNTVAASDYLTKFSKLIRLVLDNSGKEKILLSSELYMLQLYIEMEAMRFKEKLQYNIHLEKNVEAYYTELPPLLIQPYVENAIWHGLMPKEEGGKIDIAVSVNDDESLLIINVIDNGIGRIKSAAIKSKTTATHTSYGMKATSERIALINKAYKTGAAVQIDDLADENGNAAGTKVIIQIPV